MGILRAQHDQGQRQGKGTALPQAQHNRPAPQPGKRRIQATEQAGQGNQHDQHDRQALVLAASGQPGRTERTDQLHDHRPRQHQPRLGRAQAATDQDRWQPAKDDVGQ
ncbi:hypothetical protein D3C72_618640 [compost metagenome]